MIAFRLIDELPYQIQLQLSGTKLPDPAQMPDGETVQSFSRAGFNYQIIAANNETGAFFILKKVDIVAA